MRGVQTDNCEGKYMESVETEAGERVRKSGRKGNKQNKER